MRARRGCLSVEHLNNSLSVSLPSRGWVSGQAGHRIKLHNSNASEEGEKRGHCSLLLNQKRATPFFCPRAAEEVSGLRESWYQ